MRRTDLSNGAMIATQSVAGAGTAMVALHIQGGARAQRTDEAGFAHLAEHLLMTPCAPVANLHEAQAALFARLGGEINGFTGREHIALVGHVLAEDAVQLAEHFVHRILHCRFDAANLDEESLRLRQESAGMHSDGSVDLETLLLRCLHQAHPLNNPLFPPAGPAQPEVAGRLQTWWERVRTGPAVSLLAVGAVDHDSLSSAASSLGRLSGDPVQHCGTPLRFRPHEQQFESGAFGDAGKLIWVVPAHEAGASAEFLGHLLLGTPEGALLHSLRNHGVPLYGFDAIHLRYTDAGLLAFALDTTAATHAGAMVAVERCLADLARNPLGSGVFDAVEHSHRVRQHLDSVRLPHQLEMLARRLHCTDGTADESLTAIDFANWLPQAWAGRVLLEWPPARA